PPPGSNISVMEQHTAQTSTANQPSHEEVQCTTLTQEEVNCKFSTENQTRAKKNPYSSSVASVSIQIPDLAANAKGQAASSVSGNAEASASVVLPISNLDQ
ncbi:phosphoribulokinase/uridine kinase-like protein, partial [Corchorus olitorius]